MSGFIKFQRAIIDEAKKHIIPTIDVHKDELVETIKNHLFDLDGPRHLNRGLDAHQQYFWRAFRGFSEISTSLETLDDITFYIRRFPFEGTRITRERYLQFHVEAHYSEIYILKERLTSYLTLFKRQFRRDAQLPNAERQCETLKNAIVTVLVDVVELRGRHTHVVRFADDNIDRLSTINLLSRGSDDELSRLMRSYYREEHRIVRKLWRDRVRDNVKEIRRLLDLFFDALFPIVFDTETEALRKPRGIRGSTNVLLRPDATQA